MSVTKTRFLRKTFRFIKVKVLPVWKKFLFEICLFILEFDSAKDLILAKLKKKLHIVDGISEMRYELKYLICVILRAMNTVANIPPWNTDSCSRFFTGQSVFGTLTQG
jgi:hypothetical protein